MGRAPYRDGTFQRTSVRGVPSGNRSTAFPSDETGRRRFGRTRCPQAISPGGVARAVGTVSGTRRLETGTAAARGSNQTRTSATEHARNGSGTAASSTGRPGEQCERETCGANGVCGAFGGTIMERVADDGGHTSGAVPAANECAAAGTRMGNNAASDLSRPR